MAEKKLNLDLADSISELRYFLKGLNVRTKRFKIFFRGKSFEFDGFRSFTPDDDVSNIDWKASMKSNSLLVRQYKEEEDKKIIFLLDVGEHMVFSSTNKLKCEYSAEIVLSLVNLITTYNDKVSLICYNDKIAEYLPAKRGTKNFNIYLDILSNPNLYKGGSNLSQAIDFLLNNFNTNVSAVIIISDFLNFSKQSKHSLDLLRSRYETMAFVVKDPVDISMPDVSGEFYIQDPRTGQQMLVNPKLAKSSYDHYMDRKQKFMQESFKSAGIDYLEFTTEKPFANDMINFLQMRVKRK